MAQNRLKVRKYKNDLYDPWCTQPDFILSCTICGFPLDAMRQVENPTLGLPSMTVTGTRYNLEPGEEWSEAIDKQTVTNFTRYAQCPFCGSGSPWTGRGPEGLQV